MLFTVFRYVHTGELIHVLSLKKFEVGILVDYMGCELRIEVFVQLPKETAHR